MHGLVNRGIQRFVCGRYDTETWLAVTSKAGLEFTDFEGMLTYREVYTPRLLDAMTEVLNRPKGEIMEDMGTFLVSDRSFEPIRRLLRFGGVDFVDFLQSLDDLPDRARLAVSDLHLPQIELQTEDTRSFFLHCDATIEGYGYVLMGVLRAMADDYGTLAFLEHKGHADGIEIVSIRLIEVDYADGRRFDLGAPVR